MLETTKLCNWRSLCLVWRFPFSSSLSFNCIASSVTLLNISLLFLTFLSLLCPLSHLTPYYLSVSKHSLSPWDWILDFSKNVQEALEENVSYVETWDIYVSSIHLAFNFLWVVKNMFIIYFILVLMKTKA